MANQIDFLNTTVLKIYELLDEVASGKSSFNVKVAGYGLTKAGGGAIGGVNALDKLSDSSSFGSSLGGSSASGGGSFGSSSINSGGSANGSVSIGGSINFGGWTAVL